MKNFHLQPFMPPSFSSENYKNKTERAIFPSTVLYRQILYCPIHLPLLTSKRPPLSFWDISVANNLQRQGQRQPHQTPPPVDQLYSALKKEAISGFPFSLKIPSVFFLSHFLYFSTYLSVLGFEKLVRSLSNDIGACLTA